MTDRAPRLRLATDIDLNKARKDCDGCQGTGVKERKTIENPEQPGNKVEVPVICKCVTRGGGVKKDMLDEMLLKMDSGDFPAHMAQDIMGLPMEPRLQAIRQLEADVANPKKPKKTRVVTEHALQLIKQAMKEASYGDA